jgi:hypothetical protein
MLITSDRTGFPLLVVEEAGVEIHLLPVTKVQFGQFVTEGQAVSQTQYEEMLKLNPLVGPDHFGSPERERLFATGVLPDEALAFAHWLGDGFDLPTVREWRAVYAALHRVPPPRHQLLTELVTGPAGLILKKFEQQLHIRTMRDFSLMRGGLVEWVRQERTLVGLGVPRPEFHPNLWDVLSHEIKPIRPEARVPYFGFRLVRRGEWYLTDRDNARYLF